ncbi:hypothetical protein CMV_025606, partial [Castanea mollissima]
TNHVAVHQDPRTLSSNFEEAHVFYPFY